jgi:hypothetical protein
MIRHSVINELGRTQEELVVVRLEILAFASRNKLAGLRVGHLKPGPPEYKAEAIRIRLLSRESLSG